MIEPVGFSEWVPTSKFGTVCIVRLNWVKVHIDKRYPNGPKAVF